MKSLDAELLTRMMGMIATIDPEIDPRARPLRLRPARHGKCVHRGGTLNEGRGLRKKERARRKAERKAEMRAMGKPWKGKVEVSAGDTGS